VSTNHKDENPEKPWGGHMDIKQQIREHIIANILLGDDTAFQEDASLHESGILDSTGFLDVVTFIEEKFGIDISDDELDPENLGTLSRIASFVEGKVRQKELA
jgi:acyl carrier protein